MSLGDTIAAVATAPGRGGVAVVRVSGPEAFQVAELLSGRAPRAGRISFDRYSIHGQLLDEGVTQRAIAERLGVSLCKITRGSRFLKDPESVVRKILEQGKCKRRKGKRK